MTSFDKNYIRAKMTQMTSFDKNYICGKNPFLIPLAHSDISTVCLD